MMNAIGIERGPGPIFPPDRRFRQIFAASACKPHFVGVWDTVNSVGWIKIR